MGKNFDDFKKYVATLDTQAIQDSIIAELNELEKALDMSEIDTLIWRTRSFNAKLTMKMLEEYHNWLND